eukprot:UN25889
MTTWRTLVSHIGTSGSSMLLISISSMLLISISSMLLIHIIHATHIHIIHTTHIHIVHATLIRILIRVRVIAVFHVLYAHFYFFREGISGPSSAAISADTGRFKECFGSNFQIARTLFAAHFRIITRS